MRLKPERSPNAVDGGLREADLGGQRTATPVSAVLGSSAQRLPNQGRHPFVTDRNTRVKENNSGKLAPPSPTPSEGACLRKPPPSRSGEECRGDSTPAAAVSAPQ